MSVLQIGDRSCEFPAARLVLLQLDPTAELALFSGDAPDGTAAGRYHLLLHPDIDSLAQLDHAEYVITMPTMEQEETSEGIFLDEGRSQLEPHDVLVQFAVVDGLVKVDIRGSFAMFSDRGLPSLVAVQGTLTAALTSSEPLRDLQ
jgi:hypothetical protein